MNESIDQLEEMEVGSDSLQKRRLEAIKTFAACKGWSAIPGVLPRTIFRIIGYDTRVYRIIVRKNRKVGLSTAGATPGADKDKLQKFVDSMANADTTDYAACHYRVEEFLKQEQPKSKWSFKQIQRDKQTCTISNNTGQTCSVEIDYNGDIIIQSGGGSSVGIYVKRFTELLEEESQVYEVETVVKSLKKVKGINAAIIRYMEEAVSCFKAGSMLGAAFLLGGASEIAIRDLIETYDSKNGTSFNDQRISTAFNSFEKDFKDNWTKNNKSNAILSDMDIRSRISLLFNFYRITRNDVAHKDDLPTVLSSRDSGREKVVTYMLQFADYVESIYQLKAAF